MIDYVIFASGGNDSIALVQHSFEAKLQNVAVAYSNTGWAASWWPLRMERFLDWVESCGFSYHEIRSEGMEGLVERKKAFPRNGMQFCTTELKLKPAQSWLDSIDPDKHATCMVGVRREESEKRRSWPLLIPSSENHGGRDLMAPLATCLIAERDALIMRAGWSPLPHRSKECSPCVNLNRADGRLLEEPEIVRLESLEARTGRTMFRVKKFKGATGIRQVVEWANEPRGRYHQNQISGCDSGMCGD